MDTELTVEEIMIRVTRNVDKKTISAKDLADVRDVFAPAFAQAMEELGLEFKEKEN